VECVKLFFTGFPRVLKSLWIWKKKNSRPCKVFEKKTNIHRYWSL